MPLRTIILLTLLFLSFSTIGQNPFLDSLKATLPHTTSDTQRLRTLNTLAKRGFALDARQSISFSTEAQSLAEKVKDSLALLKAHYYRAASYYLSGLVDSAMLHARWALEIAELTEDPTFLIDANNLMGTVTSQTGDYTGAMEYQLTALHQAEVHKDSSRMATAYSNIGTAYYNHLEQAKGLAYWKHAAEILIALKDSVTAATVLNNLGIASEHPDSAIQYFTQANTIFTRYNHQNGVAHTSMNIGSRLGQKGEYDHAIPYIQKAISIFSSPENNFKPGLISGYINMGSATGHLGRMTEAGEWYEKAINLANEINHVTYLKDTYENMADLYEEKGRPDLALQYYKKFSDLKDTIFNDSHAKELAESETKYQTAQKDQKLAENELELEKQKNRQKNTLLIAVTLLLTAMGTIAYLRNRQLRKQREADHALQMEIAEKTKLRELDNIKSNFFANISHEFRTPITLMLAPLEQLQNNTVTKPERYFDIIRRNGERLLNLVNQLLDLSKLEKKQMHLQASPGDLSTFVRRLAFAFESLAHNRKINYEIQIAAKQNESWFDGDKIEKIINNLVSNAFKFTSDGGDIQLSLTYEDDHASIRIKDNGQGIPPESIHRIFDRFYQVEESTKLSTGIGLALVKECVELHHGIIEAQSISGDFTEFKVSFPINKNAFAPDEIAEIEQLSTELNAIDNDTSSISPVNYFSAIEDIDKPLILVVEDNPDLQYFIGEILSPNYRFQIAQNGKEGLAKAVQNTPNLIISDVMMPEMDGYTLLQHIRRDERTNHIPFILLTAKASDKDRIAGLEFGADDYMTKPFSHQELLVRIQNILTIRKLLRDKFRNSSVLDSTGPELPSMDKEFLSRVMQAINTHLDDEHFGVDQLSDTINMSRSQLHRKLKDITDLSPSELIRTYRLNKAKEMLINKSGTISEIAFQVGYKSLSHFSDSFKKFFGHPPTELR